MKNTPVTDEIVAPKNNFLFEVTNFSKTLAGILFIILPFVGFWIGYNFQKPISSTFVTTTEEVTLPETTDAKTCIASIYDSDYAMDDAGKHILGTEILSVYRVKFTNNPFICQMFIRSTTQLSNTIYLVHIARDGVGGPTSVLYRYESQYGVLEEITGVHMHVDQMLSPSKRYVAYPEVAYRRAEHESGGYYEPYYYNKNLFPADLLEPEKAKVAIYDVLSGAIIGLYSGEYPVVSYDNYSAPEAITLGRWESDTTFILEESSSIDFDGNREIVRERTIDVTNPKAN